MNLNQREVIDRLKALAKKDRKRNSFGAATHDYQLNPPLNARKVDSFKAKHGITLPEDYRHFITEIGNGGAGPYYGLFPFGLDDEGPWKAGVLVGEVGKPFPHTQAWNLDEDFWEGEPDPPAGVSEDEEDRLWEAWDKLLEAEYWSPDVVNGAIPITDIGCGQRQWLVVHGQQRGYVWNDYRADHGGILPVIDDAGNQVTFADWYMAWLETPIQRPRIAVARIGVGGRSRRRDFLVALMLIAVGALIGVIMALLRD